MAKHSKQFKKDAVAYLTTHTAKETIKKFKVSEPTLYAWRKVYGDKPNNPQVKTPEKLNPKNESEKVRQELEYMVIRIFKDRVQGKSMEDLVTFILAMDKNDWW